MNKKIKQMHELLLNFLEYLKHVDMRNKFIYHFLTDLHQIRMVDIGFIIISCRYHLQNYSDK